MISGCSTCLNAECTSWSTNLYCQFITALIGAIAMTGILMVVLFIIMRSNNSELLCKKQLNSTKERK